MSDTRFKRPESVLVVVFNQVGDVLLLKRRDHPDFWQSVTGSLWRGEAPLSAARRELREETGLEPGDALLDEQQTFTFEILADWRHRYAPGVTHNREHLFSLAVRDRPVVSLNPNEHSTFDWRPRAAAAAAVWSWSNQRAILEVVPE